MVFLFRENCDSEILLMTVAKDDTLTNEMVAQSDIVIINLEEGEYLANRFANIYADVGAPQVIFFIGEAEPSVALRARMPGLKRLATPINFIYLQGVLDSIQIDKARLLRFDEEQNRLRALYEISSSLLKVTDRLQIAAALEASLPHLLDGSTVLLVFPGAAKQILFMHSCEPIGPLRVEALTIHLRDAWSVLRSDMNIDWNFLQAIRSGPDTERDLQLKASSFMTTPISRGNRTEGFLTVLPRVDVHLNETFLQTFFVIGDLISVLVQNLELKEELQRRATHDGLTGLCNRQTLMEALEKECRRSQRYRQPVCVVMLDLDQFKSVNDRYGHQAGDEVLREVSRRLQESVREIDIAGRAGGEEFVCVLVNTKMDGGRIWAERFREILAARPVQYDGREIPVTASLGVAVAAGEDAIADLLIGRADTALYDAKHGGRNGVVCASEEINTYGPIKSSWMME
ncbi:GGDEF domain-containing protein [Candidatus Sumerlaeota bacterium]|nr:GGDEF domain-containing protein [Candidatus Sumerlaeota bacterium]